MENKKVVKNSRFSFRQSDALRIGDDMINHYVEIAKNSGVFEMTKEEAKKMPFQKYEYCRRCSSYKDLKYFNGGVWCISCQNTPVGQIAKQ